MEEIFRKNTPTVAMEDESALSHSGVGIASNKETETKEEEELANAHVQARSESELESSEDFIARARQQDAER